MMNKKCGEVFLARLFWLWLRNARWTLISEWGLPWKAFPVCWHSQYHQASVGGTTSFISSLYSDFAFIPLSKQINQNGIQSSHRPQRLFHNNWSLSTVDWVCGEAWWDNKFIRKKLVTWNMVPLVFWTPRWFQLNAFGSDIWLFLSNELRHVERFVVRNKQWNSTSRAEP